MHAFCEELLVLWLQVQFGVMHWLHCVDACVLNAVGMLHRPLCFVCVRQYQEAKRTIAQYRGQVSDTNMYLLAVVEPLLRRKAATAR